jgi:hypothetical protein
VAAGRERGPRPRRVSLPGVAELIRPVGPGPASDSGRQASGREAHPQKITVYLSADEFLDLERARLSLRIRGIPVDRGRLVREAIAVLMADLEAGIDTSLIAQRLRAASEPTPAAGSPADAVLAHGVRAVAPIADRAQAAAPMSDAVQAAAPLADGAQAAAPLADGAQAIGAAIDGAPAKGRANGAPADAMRPNGARANGNAVNDATVTSAGAHGGPAGPQ